MSVVLITPEGNHSWNEVGSVVENARERAWRIKTKENEMTESLIQTYGIMLTNIMIFITFFGVTISLYIQSNNLIRSISDEMKDFHGRLCEIESKRRK